MCGSGWGGFLLSCPQLFPHPPGGPPHMPPPPPLQRPAGKDVPVAAATQVLPYGRASRTLVQGPEASGTPRGPGVASSIF